MKRFAMTLLALALALPAARLQAGPFTGKSDEEIVENIDATVEKGKAGTDYTNALIKALNDETANVRVRERAAWALGELNVKAASPALLKAATHKGLLIRSAAVTALSRLRPAAAIPIFVNIAESDPILPLRQRAVVALGGFRSDKVIDPLVKFSSDAAPEIRGAAALAMASMHSKKNDFSEILKEMTADENSYVRERAERGLDIATGKPGDVLNYLKSADADIRFTAAMYFDSRAGARELEPLKDAWNTESDEDVRFQLSQAIVATKKRVQAEKERKAKEARAKAAAAKAKAAAAAEKKAPAN